jgi:hypothetical protein
MLWCWAVIIVKDRVCHASEMWGLKLLLCRWKDWLCMRHSSDWCGMSKGVNYEQNYSFLFEILILLGYYVTYVGSCFLMLWDSPWVPFSRVEQSWNVMFAGDIGGIFSLRYVFKKLWVVMTESKTAVPQRYFSSSVVCVRSVLTLNGASCVGCVSFKITSYVFAIWSQVEFYFRSNPGLVPQFVSHTWWQYVKDGGILKYFPKFCEFGTDK